MQQVSRAYLEAMVATSAEWQYGVDLLAEDEATLLENPNAYNMNATDRLVDSSASVSLDVTAKTHRSFQLTLRNDDGRYLPGAAGSVSGGTGSPVATGLVWYDVRYRPWITLRSGWNNGTKVWTKIPLGIYVLTQPLTQVQSTGATIGLSLLDKSSLLTKPFLITNSTLPTFTQNGHTVGGYANGSTFDSVMHDLATKGGIPASKHVFVPSTLTLPANYTINEGTEFWTHLQTLAGSIAHVLYFDGNGNLVRRPIPMLTNEQSVMTFAPGPYSIVSEVKRTSDLHATYNHVVVVGGSAQTGTFRGEAEIQDPTNPYYKGKIGDRIVYVGKNGKLNSMTPDPSIGSVSQAQSRALMILTMHVGQQETVELKTRNIPILEPYDRMTVQISQAGLSLDYMAQQLVWNLSHNGMTITATRWYAGN